MPKKEHCATCAECQGLLSNLLRTLASIKPLVANQEGYVSKAVNHEFDAVLAFMRKHKWLP